MISSITQEIHYQRLPDIESSVAHVESKTFSLAVTNVFNNIAPYISTTANFFRQIELIVLPSDIIEWIKRIKTDAKASSVQIKDQVKDAWLSGVTASAKILKVIAGIINIIVEVGLVTAKALFITKPMMLLSVILSFSAGIWHVRGYSCIKKLLREIDDWHQDFAEMIKKLKENGTVWLERRGLTKELLENDKVNKEDLLDRLNKKKTKYILDIIVQAIGLVVLGVFVASLLISIPSVVLIMDSLYLCCIGLTIAGIIHQSKKLKDHKEIMVG